MKLIITGSSSGIGKAICSKLLKLNHTVIGISRSPICFSSSSFSHEKIDLADLANLPENLKKLQQEHPNIDGIIFCAGRGLLGSLEQHSFNEIKQVIDLNFTSQAILTKAFLPLLKKRKSGNLIYIGSEAALAGKKNGAIYCASKFALRGFTQALREECIKSSIQVTLINPGMVNTPFFDTLPYSADESHSLQPEDIANIIPHILSQRPGCHLEEINLKPQNSIISHKNPIASIS